MSFKLFEKFYHHHGNEGLKRLQRRLHDRLPDGRRVTLEVLAREFSTADFQLSLASISRLRDAVFEQRWPLKASIKDFLRFKRRDQRYRMEEVDELLDEQKEYDSRLMFMPGEKEL